MTIGLLERGRRAVYHALSLVLSDHAALLRAFEVWEERFAHPRGFRVNLYVNALAEGLRLEEAKIRALSSAIYAAMTMPEEKLAPLPVAMRTRKVPAPAAAQALSGNPRLAIFTSLIAALIEGVGRLNRLEDFVVALNAQQPRLAPGTLQARATWIDSALVDLQQFAETVPLAERRSVLNDLYLALCDSCGPVEADSLLRGSVDAIERIPDAQVYSPRQLL
jgi:hypothetical protein